MNAEFNAKSQRRRDAEREILIELLVTFALGLMVLLLIGCASRSVRVGLPPVRIQETTNNLPPVWPSESTTTKNAENAKRELPPVPGEENISQKQRKGTKIFYEAAAEPAGQATTLTERTQTNKAASVDGAGISSVVRSAIAPYQQRRVMVAWSNAPAGAEGRNWFTAIAGSTDLMTWSELMRMSYGCGGEVFVTLSQRPAAEFYRAYNGER